MTAAEVAARCQHASPTTNGYDACCPAHDDQHASLSIADGVKGAVMKCQAGCTTDAVLAQLGLSMQDLFTDAWQPHQAPGARRRIVATYDYVDAAGTLGFQVVRYEPKTFKQRRPDPDTPGAWLWKMTGVTLVLYHLPEVLAAVQAGQVVYICEGEKDADALRALGLTATCNPGGAEKWRPSYTESLRGAVVVLLPDNDAAGRNHAALVARRLHGTVASLTVVALPGLLDKGDVSDWLAAGGDLAQLEALGQATPVWEPTAGGRSETGSTAPSLDPAALLEALRALPEDQRSGREVFAAIDALAGLPMHEWAIWKGEAKTLLGSRLNLNDLERARSEVRQQQRALAMADTPGDSEGELAAEFATQWQAVLTYDLRRQTWMAYKDDGRWTPRETERVSQGIVAFLDERLHGDYTWHMLSGVERLVRTRLAKTLPSDTPGWLPLRNGALDLATMTLAPHRPDRPFTWQLPYDYAPHATCPETLAWLHATVGKAHDQVQVLRAYAKAVVTRRVDLQRYLETIGPGGTGKGTYTRLLQGLVGRENTDVTELKHLEANRFETSSLQGKLLMLVTDAERYSGPVNQLKAITGQDDIRMEAKYKDKRSGIAPVMVVISANEPVQSADYTSGLERRRLSVPFLHRPATPRDLLFWQHDAWHGALAAEIPGVLNWVLALPDAAMETLLRQTTTAAPSLLGAWKQALLDTNSLADWANRALVHDLTPNDKEELPAVNVGYARKIDRSNSYECDGVWLYPTYRAWIEATGGHPLSAKRFTGALKDLLLSQLKLAEVTHTDDRNGSQFHGIRFITSNDADLPLLITWKPAPVKDVTDGVTAETRTSDGCDSCDTFVKTLLNTLPTPSVDHATANAPDDGYDAAGGEGVSREVYKSQNPSQLSHPSPGPRNAIRDLSHAVTASNDVEAHPSHAVTANNDAGLQTPSASVFSPCPRCGALSAPALREGQPACDACSGLTDTALQTCSCGTIVQPCANCGRLARWHDTRGGSACRCVVCAPEPHPVPF